MKPLFDLDGLTPKRPRKLVRDLPPGEQPLTRWRQQGVQALSAAELLAVLLQTGDALALGQDLLHRVDGQLFRLAQLSAAELKQLPGIGDGQAARLQAALELGRRVLTASPAERTPITSPGAAAELLRYEMMHLTQEQLRVLLLDTRNRPLGQSTVYVGSLNTSVVRIGEVFKEAITRHAAAIIVVHNHPSGAADPSPEDIAVTRQLVQAGKLLDIDVLDHLIIGRPGWVSLKERGLGFE